MSPPRQQMGDGSTATMVPLRTDYDEKTRILTVEAERANNAPATAVVIFGHGLGDSPEGWRAPAQYWATNLPWVKFLLPSAPNVPVTINGGMVMPSWFDIESRSRDQGPEPYTGLDDSRATYNSLVEQEAAKLPGGASRVVVAGFSQGGGVALYTGLLRYAAYPKPLPPVAGILSMSASLTNKRVVEELIASGSFAGEAHAQLKKTPVLQCHGGAEGPQRPRRHAEFMKTELGMEKMDFHEYDGMGHTACIPELDDVTDWLLEVLPEKVGTLERAPIKRHRGRVTGGRGIPGL